jgi:hypothetical protein
MSPDDQVKINLNQNLWGLVVGLGALGVGEYYELCMLRLFGIIVSVVMLISLVVTTFAYTWNYVRNKMCRRRSDRHTPKA